MPLKFHSSFGLELSIAEVVSEIVRFMRADQKRAYKIIIGSDSEALASKDADFVSATASSERSFSRLRWRASSSLN